MGLNSSTAVGRTSTPSSSPPDTKATCHHGSRFVHMYLSCMNINWYTSTVLISYCMHPWGICKYVMHACMMEFWCWSTKYYILNIKPTLLIYVVLVILIKVLDGKAWAMTMMLTRGRYHSDGVTEIHPKFDNQGQCWLIGINCASSSLDLGRK